MAALLTLSASPAAADTHRVRNTNDHGPGSLRGAVANADSGDLVVVPAGRYRLTTGQLVVDEQLRIRGAGARRTIIDGQDNDRVMEVTASATRATLSGLTIRDGFEEDDNGGGIYASVPLVLDRVAVRSNRVRFQDNWHGGGIYGTEVVLRRSTLSGNRGYNGGGVSATEVRAFASTIAGNLAGGPTSNGEGGGIDATTVRLQYSTLVGNSCFNGTGCAGGTYGGGLTAQGSILARNRAYESNGQAPGSAGNPGQQDNCAATPALASLGFNLEGGTDCELSQPSDISGVDPRLLPLGNYGGPTDTMALRRASPALNEGQADCAPGRDQRGVSRPQGRRCDIGAYERRLR